MFREVDQDMVMFFVYRVGSEETYFYSTEVPPSKSEETEKNILKVYGDQESYEVYKADIKRLTQSQNNDN